MVLPLKHFTKKDICSFEAKIKGKLVQGFVVKKGKEFFAYRNVCQHLPVTLDLMDDNFFTHDKRHLQCHMHGAMYEVETGFCVAGPCQGARLSSLPILVEPARIVVTIPDGE